MVSPELYKAAIIGKPERRIMKKILIGVAVLVVIAIVAVIILLGSLDKIVKNVIEDSGSELMGVPVTVAEIDIKVFGGAAQITGLKIPNPAGYTTQDAFKMELIRLDIGLLSLLKSPLTIEELIIDSPVVTLEIKEDGKSNLQELLDNIKRNSEKGDEAAAEEKPEDEAKKEPAPSQEPTRLAFSKLVIKGVTVNVIQESSDKEPVSVTIPPIELTDVGGEIGVTPAKLGVIVVGGIIESALENALKETVKKEAGKAAAGLFKKFGSKSGEKKD